MPVDAQPAAAIRTALVCHKQKNDFVRRSSCSKIQRLPRACGTIGHQVSESNRLPALRTKPISRLETDGVKWFWQSFGKVNSAILLKVVRDVFPITADS